MLNELLVGGARQTPDKPFVVMPQRTVTYSECLATAERYAAGLVDRKIDRFAAKVDDVANLLALLSASSAVGAEACQYARTTDAATVRELAAHFHHGAVLADHEIDIDEPPVIQLGELEADGGGELLSTRGERSPLMILTTGTTGMPKGARHDWSRLVETHRRRVGDHDARWLLAHVPNQFAGLGVLLHVMASGSTLVVPAEYQPRAALVAMLEHQVTHISTTPTFWRFLLGLLRDEDSARLPLRQITLAGEAVPSALLEDLYRRFPGVRISQIYGATEFGSSVAVGDAQNGLPLSVLERGDDADVQFKVIDGELHVRSRIGMLGYYGSDDVGDSWRPTGDLVEVQDDRILFVGRASEIINVGGVKVQPLPIEDLITKVPGVELAHVYGRSNAMTGQIVAVDIVASAESDTEALETAVRDACDTLPAPSRPRRIKFVDELDVRDTKIRRRVEHSGSGS